MAIAFPVSRPDPSSSVPPPAHGERRPSAGHAVALAGLTAVFVAAPWLVRPLEAWLPADRVALVGQIGESVLGVVLGIWTFLLLRRQGALSRRHASEIERLTDADALTGLGNERALARDLERALNRARRTREPVSVLYFDIDALREVNRRHGHIAGNQTLRMMGAVLRSSVRFGSDAGYRVDADEFALVLAADREAAQAVCRRLDRNFSERTPHHSRLSVGIATWTGHGTPAHLIDDARHALAVQRQTSRVAAMA